MHASDERLAAFLAGELDPDAARALDEHLLDCERCWESIGAARLGRRAAEQLRQPTPATLADRIRLAIELAPDPARPKPARARRGRWVAVAAATVALIAALVLAALTVPRHSARHDPAVITALVHLAGQPGAQPAPARASPAATQLGGQAVELSRYPVAGRTVIEATSALAFPMPADAQVQPGTSMSWTITRAAVTVYCPHAKVILAGPVPAATLAALAAQLRLD